MSQTGLNAYWEFYRKQSKLIITDGLTFKDVKDKKNYINSLWKIKKEDIRNDILEMEIIHKKIDEELKKTQEQIRKEFKNLEIDIKNFL
jgi:hypothetical protein